MNVVYRSVLDEVAEAKARASKEGRIIDRIEVSPEELEALKREAEQAGVPVEGQLGSYRTVLGVRVITAHSNEQAYPNGLNSLLAPPHVYG